MQTFRLASAVLCLGLVLPGVAAAQLAAPQGTIPGGQRSTGTQAAPAPALPGVPGRRATGPIAADPAANLSPNAALFDAIARGDLAAARDAVGRGANLEARNALGLTPIDAAVDQGRHDISFYLLSARDISRAPAEPASSGLSSPPPSRREAVPTAATQGAAATIAAAARQPTAAPATPRAARLWAGDGGAPRPEIGFLGFDAGRPAGAEPPAGRRPGRG
jgi:hypothetical protein